MDSADLLQDEPEAAQRPHDEDEDEDVVGRALSVAGAGAPLLFPYAPRIIRGGWEIN